MDFVIRKALPKFPENKSTLLVLIPRLFLSPLELPIDFLSSGLKSAFNCQEFTRIGGILIIQPLHELGKGVDIHHFFFANPNAKEEVQLPPQVVQGLISGSKKQKRSEWQQLIESLGLKEFF